MKKLFSAPKTPQKLITAPLDVDLNNNNNNKTLSAKKEEPKKENISNIKPELKEVKVSFEDKKEEINNNKDNNNNEEINKDLKEKEEDKEKKEIKDPLLEDDLDDKENIEDVISYLNGLDYDKYCKDMEIREALTLLKHKMDKEKQEQKDLEEKAENKVTIEGVEKSDEKNKEKEKDEEKNNNMNKTLLPDISNKTPEQNKVEIVDEEELKRKEEIKKYKIAEQIAKTEQMKKVHSVNSIKKLLEREGLDKLNDQPPLRITVIKENPIANMDELQTNKLPFLHSLPLV